MSSPRATAAATQASISLGDKPSGRAVDDTMRRERASTGWSHSNVTPTTSSPAPIANRISVVDGSKETIRMLLILPEPQGWVTSGRDDHGVPHRRARRFRGDRGGPVPVPLHRCPGERRGG